MKRESLPHSEPSTCVITLWVFFFSPSPVNTTSPASFSAVGRQRHSPGKWIVSIYIVTGRNALHTAYLSYHDCSGTNIYQFTCVLPAGTIPFLAQCCIALMTLHSLCPNAGCYGTNKPNSAPLYAFVHLLFSKQYSSAARMFSCYRAKKIENINNPFWLFECVR